MDEATRNSNADLFGSIFQLAFQSFDNLRSLGFIQSGFLAPKHIYAEDHGTVLIPDKRGWAASLFFGKRRIYVYGLVDSCLRVS